jgi:hypothetical protein
MWEPFNFFIGTWQGHGHGQPGISRLQRKYELILNEKFLFVQSKSIYEPQEKNPKGETHEEWGLISYDRARKTYVFRQFHLEGFVNQYVSAEVSEDRKTIRFVTEAIENIAPGWKARESYQILGSDEFSETFELAAPDKEFEIYSENHFQRVRSE